MRRFGQFLFGLAGVGLVVVVLLLVGGFLHLRGSLPPLDGEVVAEGILAELVIERDSLGVPAIRASSLHDVVWAQGFVHGQDRFFQMDMLRRLVAGELAALVGEPALASDRRFRAYGYREAAERHLEALEPSDRALLDAYVAGVNAGVRSPGRPPPEYLVFRSDPEPWEAVDSVLAFLYFYIDLSTHYRYERHLRTLHAEFPAELARFLTPDATRFDAPVMGATDEDPTGGYEPLPIPGPGVVDRRTRGSQRPAGASDSRLPRSGGSNAWAILGDDGSTLVANDPHLAITLPGIWYRVDLNWPGHRVAGASPPGLPGVFVGMSRRLAWGVTAALIDQTDLVELELHPEDSLVHRVPGGWDTLRVRRERLEVRGGEPVELEVRESRWGPVLFEGHDGVPLALRSPAFDPGGSSMRQFGILEANSLEQMIELLRELGGPGLSLVMADDSGRIAWMVTGVLPLREGHSGNRPVSYADPDVGWIGVRAESERPVRIIDEPDRLHTANQRLLPLPEARELSHLWMPPQRARRLDDRLGSSELDGGIGASHDLQLDTRSLLHEPLRRIALDALADLDSDDPLLDSVRVYLDDWDGTARADAPHFRIVEGVGAALLDGALEALVQPVRDAIPGFEYRWPLDFEPALRVLEERPAHLLPSDHADWNGFLRGLVRTAATQLQATGEDGLATRWGEANRLQAAHPFASLAGPLDRFLRLPSAPQSGWSGAVRASSPAYGQSLRMVARPGAFDQSLFTMPGGQSGNPFSPYWIRGHRAWIEGNPAPISAGPALHVLTLTPPAR